MNSIELKNAIVSVYDKSGLEELVRALTDHGVKIYSTGGTYRYIEELGFRVYSVYELTHFPEIMQGRVKTLHPGVLGGILCDRLNPEHVKELEENKLHPVDLVVVNLYPFEQTLKEGRSHSKLIEMIDIGGPTMLRAAAKNYSSALVLTSPAQYGEFIERVKRNDIDLTYREKLACETFTRVAEYDIAIARYFQQRSDEELPEKYFCSLKRGEILRYGENPHQKAAFYLPAENQKPLFRQLHGKQLSFNNYGDLLSAYEMVATWKHGIAVAIVKHANPCGFATGDTPLEAYKLAVETDPVSYFGGIVAFNREVDDETAEALVKPFLECIIAPGFSDSALEIMKKKKNLRIIIPDGEVLNYHYHLHSLGKGVLIQSVDKSEDIFDKWDLKSDRAADSDLRRALELGWHVVKYVKSNAIVLANASQTVGIGAGQMSRVDAMKIAIRKAKEAGLALSGSVIASDAFFPFRDSVDLAGREGIAAVVEPGGSIRDREVIEAANEHNIALYFTRTRHFRHY